MLYSGKSGGIRAKWLNSGKVIVFGKSGCIKAKLVLFQKIDCIPAKWL